MICKCHRIRHTRGGRGRTGGGRSDQRGGHGHGTHAACTPTMLISLIPIAIFRLRNGRSLKQCATTSYDCEKVAAVVVAEEAGTIARPRTVRRIVARLTVLLQAATLTRPLPQLMISRLAAVPTTTATTDLRLPVRNARGYML